MAMRLVKEGFGDWASVESMPIKAAIDSFHYLVFLGEYQDTHYELNKTPDQ